MNKSKVRSKRTGLARRTARRSTHNHSSHRLLLSVLRNIVSGISIAVILLCGIAAIFANTNLPLSWIGPAACTAAAAGAFVSGLTLSRSIERFRLFAGLGCGIFYCLCSLLGSLMASHIPAISSSNLSLLAVLFFGAVAGSAAGALHNGSAGGVR